MPASYGTPFRHDSQPKEDRSDAFEHEYRLIDAFAFGAELGQHLGDVHRDHDRTTDPARRTR
jgi:hypothetical protein